MIISYNSLFVNTFPSKKVYFLFHIAFWFNFSMQFVADIKKSPERVISVSPKKRIAWADSLILYHGYNKSIIFHTMLW